MSLDDPMRPMDAPTPPLRLDDIPFLTYTFLYRSTIVPICLRPTEKGYTSKGVFVMALGTKAVSEAEAIVEAGAEVNVRWYGAPSTAVA